MKISGWAVVIIALMNMSDTGGGTSLSDDCQKTYVVHRCDVPPQVDGHADPAEWSSAVSLTDFSLHWESVSAPRTGFRGLHDGSFLYFCYEAVDTNLVLWETVAEEMDVVYEDRVELFFTPDRRMAPYYCFEIDPLGRALDNSGSLGKPIDPGWNCTGLLLAGTHGPESYTVEGRIPLASLAEIGVYRPGEPMLTGLFRAEFNGTGKPRSPDMHWISWIRPDSDRPNFHIPSAFGCFVFE